MPVPGLVYRHARCHQQTTQGLTPGPGDVGGASRERTGRSPGHPSPAGHEGLSRPMSVCVRQDVQYIQVESPAAAPGRKIMHTNTRIRDAQPVRPGHRQHQQALMIACYGGYY